MTEGPQQPREFSRAELIQAGRGFVQEAIKTFPDSPTCQTAQIALVCRAQGMSPFDILEAFSPNPKATQRLLTFPTQQVRQNEAVRVDLAVILKSLRTAGTMGSLFSEEELGDITARYPGDGPMALANEVALSRFVASEIEERLLVMNR